MLHKIIFIFCFVLLEQKINWKILEIIEERRVREQYYLDSLNPPYNILKLAGSSSGFWFIAPIRRQGLFHPLRSDELNSLKKLKKKISKALKGVWFIAPIRRQGLFHKKKKEKERWTKRGGEECPIWQGSF